MNYNDHSDLEGFNAFLSPSSPHWLNYTSEKLITRYNNYTKKSLGTRYHEFAEECIKLKEKLPRTTKTLNLYVNDGIGYDMDTEVLLYYSKNCFGTADTIKFDGKLLRIHDLKTGETKAKFVQLETYAALFCLEYKVDPYTITMELRIYQYDERIILIADPGKIRDIMDKIIESDKVLEEMGV